MLKCYGISMKAVKTASLLQYCGFKEYYYPMNIYECMVIIHLHGLYFILKLQVWFLISEMAHDYISLPTGHEPKSSGLYITTAG